MSSLVPSIRRTFGLQQINPDQADLRIDPHTAAAWRERFAVTTDGRPRRGLHSTLRPDPTPPPGLL